MEINKQMLRFASAGFLLLAISCLTPNGAMAAGKNKKIEIAIKPQKAGRLMDVIQLKCNARNAGTKGIYKILATAKVE